MQINAFILLESGNNYHASFILDDAHKQVLTLISPNVTKSIIATPWIPKGSKIINNPIMFTANEIEIIVARNLKSLYFIRILE